MVAWPALRACFSHRACHASNVTTLPRSRARCLQPRSYIPETPSSLIQRGQLQAGRAALRAIRGPLQPASELDREFNSILAAAGISEHTSAGHWSQARKLVRREQLPPLLLLTLLTAIRQLSGGDFVLLFNTPMQKSECWCCCVRSAGPADI